MNKLNITLLTIATAITLAACAPATDGNLNAMRLSVPEGVITWSGGTVSGMPVQYRVVKAIQFPDGTPLPTGAIFAAPSNGVCDVQISDEYFLRTKLQKNPEETRRWQIRMLATHISGCLNGVQLDWDTNGFEDVHAYSDAWGEMYLEQCGYRAQPLGWPIEDGACEVPAATDPKPGT